MQRRFFVKNRNLYDSIMIDYDYVCLLDLFFLWEVEVAVIFKHYAAFHLLRVKAFGHPFCDPNLQNIDFEFHHFGKIP